MLRKTVIALAMLVLVPTGCSERLGDPGVREAEQPAASPPLSHSAAATTPPPVPTTRENCQAADAAAREQFAAEFRAISLGGGGAAQHAAYATAYRDFAVNLALIALDSTGTMRSALTEWASASAEIARFVTRNAPRTDFDLDFSDDFSDDFGVDVELGPAYPRWTAAREAVEDICGHPLPRFPPLGTG